MKDKNNLITIEGNSYLLSNEPIKNNDWIYNKNADVIDKCLMIGSDGLMTIESCNGWRAILSNEHYKKAILQK